MNAHQGESESESCTSYSMHERTRSCFCDMASSPMTPTIRDISSHHVRLLHCVTTELLTICSTRSMSEQFHLHTAIRFTLHRSISASSHFFPSFLFIYLCSTAAFNSNTESCNCKERLQNYTYIILVLIIRKYQGCTKVGALTSKTNQSLNV